MGLAQPAKRAIGLLGGSFDPIHRGHLQLARDALAQLPLAEMRFIPAAQPWRKDRSPPRSTARKMVQLVLADEPRFALDMHEVERGGVTYTIDTLKAIRAIVPSRPLVLIPWAPTNLRGSIRGWDEIIEQRISPLRGARETWISRMRSCRPKQTGGAVRLVRSP